MVSVSVAELQSQLQYFLRIVHENGESVEIKDNNVTIAFLNNGSVEQSSDKIEYFKASISDWRNQYSSLFEDSDIDQIFSRERTIEDDIRHSTDIWE